jgi:hypothetical protein
LTATRLPQMMLHKLATLCIGLMVMMAGMSAGVDNPCPPSMPAGMCCEE